MANQAAGGCACAWVGRGGALQASYALDAAAAQDCALAALRLQARTRGSGARRVRGVAPRANADQAPTASHRRTARPRLRTTAATASRPARGHCAAAARSAMLCRCAAR
jgi:hypothetical protein